MLRAFLIAVALTLAFAPALAQAPPSTLSVSDRVRGGEDLPLGAPYNVVSLPSEETVVPLRDYLSSRIDQLRAEMFDRFALVEHQQQAIMDERDRQYAQRFAAQQEAVSAALQAAKEAVANALSAAKEAVTKAEDASNKRFDSVNEFRDQLRDQADNFMGKEAAEARFNALDEKVAGIISRLDSLQGQGIGATSLWGFIIGGLGLLLAGVAYFGTLNRHKP